MKIRMKGPDPAARLSVAGAPDVEGCVDVPYEALEQAMAHGFTICHRGDAAEGEGSQRPQRSARRGR